MEGERPVLGRSCWLALPPALAGLMALADSVNGAEPPDLPPEVAAMVNGTPITVRELELEWSRAMPDHDVDPSAVSTRAKILSVLIDRELILQWLATRQQVATRREIELEIERFKKRLQARDIPWEEFLESKRMRRVDLERLLRWRLSWARFLEKYLTDENLERFFRDRRADFDGTRLRVAHILLPVDRSGDGAANLERPKRLAQELRDQITAGELSFAEAARLRSEAPTAERGGELGLISRHEPMPEHFSAAAFGLAEGEVSVPVVSPFGVHLIKCQEILPGKKRWTDVRDELEQAMMLYLFEWAADRTRGGANVEVNQTIGAAALDDAR